MAATYKDTDGKGKTIAQRDKVGKGRDAAFRGYINVSLSDEQKKAYVKWAVPTKVFEVFSRAVSSGVNVAIKLDPKGDTYLASATQRDERSINAGLCVTARSGDAVTAFGRLMFLLALLDEHDSWEATQPVADPDRW